VTYGGELSFVTVFEMHEMLQSVCNPHIWYVPADSDANEPSRGPEGNWTGATSLLQHSALPSSRIAQAYQS